MTSFLAHAELGFDSFLLPGGEDGIVLLHGFTASPVEVRQLADFLNAQGYTASGPLLPGHGTHPDDLNRVKFEDWVRFSEAAVEVRQLADFLNAQGYTASGPLLPGHGTHPDDLNRVKFEDWVRFSEAAVE